MDYDSPSIQDGLLFGAGPPDKYRVAWWIVLLMGVGSLFPWNAFITAGDYFMSLYAETNGSFMQFVTLSNTYTGLIFLMLSVKFGHHFSIRGRIIVSFVLIAICFVAIPVMDYAGLDVKIAMWITLACAAICGLATAIVSGAISGYVAMLPSNYFTALMAGQGVAGIIVGVLRIITKAAVETGSVVSKEQVRLSALIYFSVAGFVIVLCIVSVNIFVNLPFVKYHVNKSKDVEAEPLLGDGSNKYTSHAENVAIMPVIKKLWLEAAEVFFNFFVTLSLFPGVMFMIQGDDPKLHDSGWLGIILVALFQLFDYVGRQLPSLYLIPMRFVWLPTLLRAAFFPLWVLCVKPLVFVSNWWSYAFMVIFATSNGYLGSAGMIYGPQRVADYQKEIAGVIMMFFLQFGLFLGLHFNFFFLWLFDPKSFWAIFGIVYTDPLAPVAAPFVMAPTADNSTAPMASPVAILAPVNQTLF